MTIGLESWFHNFSQFIYKANTPESLADIPRPYLEYSIWGLFKGAEISSVIGGCIAHPLYRLFLHRRLDPEKITPNSYKIIRSTCRRLQGRFLLCGLAFGPVVTMLHSFHSGDEAAIRALCYDIRCNTFALSMDRFAFVFGFIGWYWKRFQGAVDGINIAIAYSLINAKIIAPRTSPLLIDKVKPQERYESVEVAMSNQTRLKKFLADEERRKILESMK